MNQSLSKDNRKQMEPRDRPIKGRVTRVTAHLNDLLTESFPERAQDFEVVPVEVKEHVNPAICPDPIPVSYSLRPTYEFYLQFKSQPEPRKRVMILHGPDLRERIHGGIKNERAHYQIPYFKESLERGIAEIESATE